MFTVKRYDLGTEIEQVGFYQDVVDAMQAKKKNVFRGSDTKYRKRELTEQEKKEQNQEKALQRARTKIRRLTQRYNMRYMWTLTFAKKKVVTFNPVTKQTHTYDAGNYDDAWRLWKSFLKRCKDNGLEFNYIVTIEVQEERLKNYGEKVYHFHFITDKQIPHNAVVAKRQGKKYNLTTLWGHGHVFVTRKKSKKKLAHLYIVKYLSKLINEMGVGRQRYRVREGMVVPCERVVYCDHTAFFTSVGKENIKKTSYSLLGDLEIFWMIYEKDYF